MKKPNKRTRFWLLYHTGLLIFSFITAFIMKFQQAGDPFHESMLVAFISIFMMSAGIGYLAIYMVKRAARFSSDQLRRRLLPYLLLFYLAAGLIANLGVTAGVFAWFVIKDLDLSQFWHHLFSMELNFANFRFFIWLMFFTIAFFYVLWQKTATREQKLREENLSYRYRNLKAQVNPHFLFNNLNTLSELVHEDQSRAENYIRELSNVYRYILENEDTELVSLDTEIEFVIRYFELQRVRDENKIKLEIDIKDAGKFRVVPVSLQILVENALKHNVMTEEEPLVITISGVKDSYVMVSNPLRKKTVPGGSHKTGLLNLEERVSLITGKDVIISDAGGRFTVKLPIIPA